VVLGATELITPEDLPEVVESETIMDAPVAGYYETIREAKRQLITKTLRQTGGNFTEAAKLLDMHPNNLHRLVTNLKLRETC
jgi:DNA-binding NtrC family response regulator